MINLVLKEEMQNDYNTAQMRAKKKRLNFLSKNYDSLTFHEILFLMDVRESTLIKYHYDLRLEPRKETATKFEKAILLEDFLKDLGFDYLCKKHKFSKLFALKVLEKEINKLKVVDLKLKRVKRHWKDGLNKTQILRAIECELYEIKENLTNEA